MNALVECVPNFSEGRDKSRVETIVSAARAVNGIAILDVETDPDHNRCVLSFVGSPEAVVEACFQVAKRARELIDLNNHKGEHPRMGAVDVIPFIPVTGIDIEECASLAEKLGQRIGQELEIPVYLYDHAARTPERKDLAFVRKGQFEGLRDLIGKDPARIPDFGPNRIHPTAGAVAVGARNQIVNFNLNLSTHDMAAGKDIAKRVRTSGGGLPALRAKEIDLASRKQVQISTVLTDYKATSIKRVVVEVSKLAAKHKAEILTAEIVGLLPQEALVDFALETLKLENFDPDLQILERRLQAMAPSGMDWRKAGEVVAEALSNTDATPGGGAAAGICGAMGCGLGLMAIGISLKSKKLEETKHSGLERAQEALKRYKTDFHKLTGEDAAAFDRFMEAAGLPKEDISRASRMQTALVHAAEIPLQTATLSAEAYVCVRKTLSLTVAAVTSDMNCAARLLKAAAFCAAENVRINLSSLKDKVNVEQLSGRLEACLRVFTT